MYTISFRERFHVPKYNDVDEIEPGIVSFDLEKCKSCFQCREVCPARAIEKKNKLPVMSALNECVYCGDCEAICPEDAVKLEKPNRLSGCYKTINTGKPSPPRLHY